MIIKITEDQLNELTDKIDAIYRNGDCAGADCNQCQYQVRDDPDDVYCSEPEERDMVRELIKNAGKVRAE